MDWPTTFLAAQALVAAWNTPPITENDIRFAVNSIEYVCKTEANPDQCGEDHWWMVRSGRQLIDLVDQTKRERRQANRLAGIAGPPEIPLCRPPHKMTARDGCQ
jgi:hypothetical protein